jgi:hypothetical protein
MQVREGDRCGPPLVLLRIADCGLRIVIAHRRGAEAQRLLGTGDCGLRIADWVSRGRWVGPGRVVGCLSAAFGLPVDSVEWTLKIWVDGERLHGPDVATGSGAVGEEECYE